MTSTIPGASHEFLVRWGTVACATREHCPEVGSAQKKTVANDFLC